ncbi:MAG TPA: hypothetical protein VFP79_06685 [Pseudolabrys sp.]|nr:hypothetical protein [Pseudolabrys sp.]
MPVDFIASNTTDGLTLKLYRGEDMVLLAFDMGAAAGEQGNGDNLIEIHDAKVVIAYAVQAVSIFDHYGFRNRMKEARPSRRRGTWPAPGKPAWWEASFKPDDYKCRDRLLFAG